MKYWILLATSLFLVACGGGESGGFRQRNG